MDSKRIYTDIDFVLNDYRESFLQSARDFYHISEYNIGRANKIVDLFNKSNGEQESPLQVIAKELYLSQSAIEILVDEANKIEIWYPTVFAQSIIDFINNRVSEGYELAVITARNTRNGAESIIEKIFGKDVPICTCESMYKHLFIEDGSIYFEDDWRIVKNCQKRLPNTQIFVPEWPWSVGRIEENDMVRVFTHEEMKDIESIYQGEF